MASLFRARRRAAAAEEDEPETSRPGAGGKIVKRTRSSAAAASPYARPPPPAAAPVDRERSEPTWMKPLTSILSGAGWLMNTVFGSDSGSQDEMEDSEEEGEEKELQRGQEMEELEVDYNAGSMTLLKHGVDNSKAAIEQLLQEETFSRDECDNMIRIIQSRVVEDQAPSVNVEHEFKKKNLLGSVGSGHSVLSGSLVEVSPELSRVALVEARKWMEEKKAGSGSKSESYRLPISNNNMLQNSADGSFGSPVDLAKTYMQSLPPRQSPLPRSSENTIIKSKYQSGISLESSRGLSSYSIPSSEVLRQVQTRDYFSSRLWDHLGEPCRSPINFLDSVSASSQRQSVLELRPSEADDAPKTVVNEERPTDVGTSMNVDTTGSVDAPASAQPVEESSLADAGATETAQTDSVIGYQPTNPSIKIVDGNINVRNTDDRGDALQVAPVLSQKISDSPAENGILETPSGADITTTTPPANGTLQQPTIDDTAKESADELGHSNTNSSTQVDESPKVVQRGGRRATKGRGRGRAGRRK